MRNILPLVSLGCIAVIILGVITGGAVMLGYGLIPLFDKSSSNTTAKQPHHEEKGPGPWQPGPPGVPVPPAKTKSLGEERKNFKTELRNSSFKPSENEPDQVRDAKVIHYPSGSLKLAAYLSNDRPGPRRPAVVWAHGGFGEIGPDDWEQAKKFHDAGCVLMVPSFRGENDNKGRFEMFYGEVDDLLAAVAHVSRLPSVDPNRVYVAGHSSGGTLTLLAAEMGTPESVQVRAYFSIAGMPDTAEFIRVTLGKGYDEASPPYDVKRLEESRLRSALPFTGAITKPTFYIGVRGDLVYANQAVEMKQRAVAQGVPFEEFILAKPNHFKVVGPVVDYLSRKIAADVQGASTTIHITQAELELPFK
jgi:acetyl esterase/lipase